jgi:hypothetical protein
MTQRHCAPFDTRRLSSRHAHSSAGLQKVATDPVMDTELATAEPGEVALSLIGASTVIGLEFAGMVDALHRVGRMQDVPPTRLIGMNLCTVRDDLPNHRNGLAFAVDNPGYGWAETTLTGDDDNLALGTPLLSPIGSAVLGTGAGTKESAINLDFAFQFVGADRRAHSLASLVKQHEGALGVNVHVPRHPQRGHAFDPVAEQTDYREVIAERELTGVE